MSPESKLRPAVTRMPASFPQFPQLPPEMRLMIWEASLPTIEPALYPFRPGLREVRPLEDDESEDYEVDGDTLKSVGKVIFRDDLLISQTLYAIPGVLVNIESYAAARRWMRKTGIRLYRSRVRVLGDWRDWTFRRRFDADRFGDAVYVMYDERREFLWECEWECEDLQYNSFVHGGFERAEVLSFEPWIHPIAIDYKLLELDCPNAADNTVLDPEDRKIFSEICHFAQPRKLSIILDEPEVFNGWSFSAWTFRPVPGEIFCWSAEAGAFQLMKHDIGCHDRQTKDRLFRTFKILMEAMYGDPRKVAEWAKIRRPKLKKDDEEDGAPEEDQVGLDESYIERFDGLEECRVTVHFISVAGR
ncbi:hypothetical protein BJ166DRAFT_596385 [Pestalotiopsis sp. NC0098]|nr:hypothetical protein BJ166DRAFT_596385 [Pestalotiopsis sp. NC0098]